MPRVFVLLLSFLLGSRIPATAAAPSGDDGVRVSVLGYHDFSETEPETEMRIRTSKFRQQMQTLQDLGIPVIPMSDFIAWRQGEKSIPKQCAVITIDDGWKAVYTDAYPILKEFQYPFTLFLYKNYIDGGSKALTTSMVEEMQKNGAELGSHSVTHPYPATVKSHRKKGPADYEAFLRTEFGESKHFLDEHFHTEVTTYAYPGGFHTQEMYPIAHELGYRYLFTVLPGKVTRDSDDLQLPRYVVLGTHDPIFDLATRFGAGGVAGSSVSLATSKPLPYPVSPEPGAMIEERLPTIAADLSDAGDIDPSSLHMEISGFGTVPAVFDPSTSKLSWKINRPLRREACQVHVSWKRKDGTTPEEPLRWAFRIDPEGSYMPLH
ncbi:peptidoglycan/xylan/chitin deacetylase (PgdA/CDA1 family) [Haloferula luteola]|uniref:Peptidoglycan/xylan/chitin deacetylase (PgdA/CDA1 family) n=1 Tax=Haloferula luteola TaxID=595692 RepID=A0A840VC99_9BACT|nr:polysaccharide deacetylase family protein [Haloferula luteola]MBB5352288.1 peptidoglycan/xylan/chitin deacetylase (PgdA/CDA1 family) [Haloferula luteola]